jgi:hypothetical protein
MLAASLFLLLTGLIDAFFVVGDVGRSCVRIVEILAVLVVLVVGHE